MSLFFTILSAFILSMILSRSYGESISIAIMLVPIALHILTGIYFLLVNLNFKINLS